MKKYYNILILLVAFSVSFSSCKKEFAEPNVSSINKGNVVTIADVRAMEVLGTEVRIIEDISVYGVVTMDESTGNLYKEAYITDATGNLYLRFISSSSLYIGDSIMVNLNGAKILRYNQMLQVDSLHPDNNIKKIATQVYKTPEKISINTLQNDMEAAQGKLIEIERCWFQAGGQGLTFAYAATQTAESRILEDMDGATIDVRTSGYANFANDTLPDGFGSFIGIVAQYNSGLQLLIRNPNELGLTGTPPVLSHTKDFNDQSLISGGWSTHLLTGPSYCAWDIFAATNSAAKVSSYNSSTSMGEISDAWLISPMFDLSSSTSPFFNFRNVVRYGTSPVLQVLISTNYDGISNPTTATWTDITTQAIWDNDDSSWSTWTSSGNLDLTPFISSSTYIAFRHEGQNISGVPTWEIDDINVYK